MRLITSSILCVTVLAGCGSSDPILFGHLDPKEVDDTEYRALQLAVDATNEDPAKRPFERRVHVVHTFAGKTPQDIRRSAIRLATVDRVFALIGGHTAEEAEEIGQAAQADERLAITMSGWPGAPTIGNLFPIGLSPSERGRCLALYATGNLKRTTVAVLIDDSSAYYRAVADAFSRTAGKIAFSAAISRRDSAEKEAESAPAELVQRVRKAKPDALLLAMPAPEALGWAKRLGSTSEGKFTPLSATNLFGGEEGELHYFQEASDSSGGWVAAAAIAPGEESERYKLFTEAYRNKYGQEPDTAAGLVYDAYQVLIQACKRASDATVVKVREELTKKDASFDVLTGTLTLGRDHTARRTVFIVSIDKTGVQRMQQYAPANDVPVAK